MKMNMQGPGGGLGRTKAAPKSLRASITKLLGYMRGSARLIAVTLALAVAGTLMQVLTPKMLGNATTVIFSAVQSQTALPSGVLLCILGFTGLLYLGIFISSFLQERLMTIVSLRTTQALRNAVKAKLARLPISYFDRHSTGDMMSIAVNDIDNIAQNLQQSLTMLISSIILIRGTLAFMLTISSLFTLIACIMVPASLLIAKLITPAAQRQNKKYAASMGALNGNIEETYHNFTVVKTFGGEGGALESFGKANESLCESGWRAKFYGQSMMHFMMLVQNALYVVIAAFGAVRVMGGRLLIGDLQAFLQYSQQFSSPVAKLSNIWSSLLSALASAERVFALLDAEELEESEPDTRLYPDSAKIVFDGVQFGYDEALLMKDFHLAVQEGETVAIVGHTGAGKTTLVNLLERFYEIQGGSIRLQGVDIRAESREALRRKIGMVLQDTWLFSGTIYENIRFGCPDATTDQIVAAAKAAHAHAFISRLPDGYDTLLQEDAGNISQGQRQLITIARAFLSAPEILILDEATSNVDSRTEMIVQKAMKDLMKGRTSFVIAHRLSTIYDADRIIVMENGDIVETGTHRTLLALGGVYADIYNSQFSLAS